MKQYYLLNNSPKQPFSDIRCFIVDDQNGGEYVMISCADIRLMGCPQAIVKRSNLRAEERRSYNVINFQASPFSF